MAKGEKPAQQNDDGKRQAFLVEYEALCKKHGLNHAASPVFVGRDDGTFSIVIQWQVVPLPPQKVENA